METFADLLKQAISPVVLISGVGLILLTLANRLGRAIDRSRELARVMGQSTDPHETEVKHKQLDVVFRRCVYLKNSVLAVVVSIACSSLMILTMLIIGMFKLNSLALLCNILLFGSVFSIVVSTFYLFLEVRSTLAALEVEIDFHHEQKHL